MNLQVWINQARAHWREFQPTRYRSLKEAGILEAELKEAAERTAYEMSMFERNGFSTHEAWEMVRETYLFPPPEPALKAKLSHEPVASEAARTFNEITRLKSELLRATRSDDN